MRGCKSRLNLFGNNLHKITIGDYSFYIDFFKDN